MDSLFCLPPGERAQTWRVSRTQTDYNHKTKASCTIIVFVKYTFPLFICRYVFFETKCDVTERMLEVDFVWISNKKKKKRFIVQLFSFFLVIYKSVLHKFSAFNYILNVVLLKRITSVHTLNQFSFGNHKLNQSMNNTMHHAKSEMIESFCHV